jgi:hypothetical protein
MNRFITQVLLDQVERAEQSATLTVRHLDALQSEAFPSRPLIQNLAIAMSEQAECLASQLARLTAVLEAGGG